MSKRITIIYGSIRTEGEDIERATAYVEGAIEETMVNVDSHGDPSEAVAEAARLSARRHENLTARSPWPREIEPEPYTTLCPMGGIAAR